MFHPIAKEIAGTWGDMAIELVQESGRRTTVITQDTRKTVILFQRLSKRGNAECGLLPQHNEHRIKSRCSRCLTFCLVFTPAALCWWVKKTRICAAEMAVWYAALSACRKVHVCHCNSLGGATWRSVTITGRTDRQTDRLRRNIRPLLGRRAA